MSGKTKSNNRLLGLTGVYRDAGFFINEEETLIGRRPECDVVIADKTISGKHARIFKDGDAYVIEDLNSTNGTFVNGEKVKQAPIHSRDVLSFHKIEFRFLDKADAELTEAVPQAPRPQSPREAAPIPPPPVPPHVQIKESPQVSPPPIMQQPPLQGQPNIQINVNAQHGAAFSAPPPPAAGAATPNNGNMAGGLASGLFIALLINIGVPFLLLLTKLPKMSTEAMGSLLRFILVGFPLLHTHMYWKSLSTNDIVPIIIALCIPLGIMIGSMICQRAARGNHIKNAISFALFYTILASFIQLAALEFNFNIWVRASAIFNLGSPDPGSSMILTLLYVLVVVFVFAFLGASLGRAKKN